MVDLALTKLRASEGFLNPFFFHFLLLNLWEVKTLLRRTFRKNLQYTPQGCTFRDPKSEGTVRPKKIPVLGLKPTNEIFGAGNLVVCIAFFVVPRSKVPHVLIGSKTHVLGGVYCT